MWKPTLTDGDRLPLFRRIVQSLADDVAAGRLTPGARLPPHRDLADDLLIARGTVARAYREAEALGLVRGDVGRGTVVLAPDVGDRSYSTLLESPTVLSDLSTNLPLSGIDPDPADVLHRLAERPDRKALLRYLPPQGVRRHRLTGVRWLRRLGIETQLDDVLVCAGAQHALFVILSHLTNRSRTLYAEELTYPGLHGIAEALKLTLVPIRMDADGIDIADLARAARRHGPGTVYCMPTIHNPTGVVMPETRRAELAALARRENLTIVEDAANRMLVERPPPPLFSYAPERSFLVASVSKILSPGLRVAFVIGPKRELPALTRLVWATQWMVGPLGAEIVSMWLEDGAVDRTVTLKRREARRRQALARRLLSGCEIAAHPTSLHVWLTLPPQARADRFVADAAKRNIVVTPSSAFWSRKTAPPPAIRISLGGVEDVRSLTRGLRSVAALVGAL